MKRKVIVVLLSGMLVGAALTACGSTEEAGSSAATVSEESEEDAEALEEAMQKEAAEKEAKAEECYAAGRAYLYGLDGKEKDLEAAFNSFEEAVDLGKEEANFYMGLLYDWESYPLQDYKQARAYYEAAGENPLAYISLGYNYYYGQGVETDQEKGKEYFDKAVALGCIDGYIGLGTVASDEGDYAAAMEDYKKAAEQGTEPVYIQTALIDVAGLYRDGLGVEQDGTQAIEWYEKAVEAGKSSGYNYIGVMYENGNGVEQDYAKAMEWNGMKRV